MSGGALAGSTTSLQGNIVNDALVIFDQNGSDAYTGSMSGTGVLSKSGSGTITLTGTNSYSGGTIINAGTLAGGTSSLQGRIGNNASLVLAAAADSAFDGILSGTGSLTKTGAGTTFLMGTHSMSGLTTVQQGTLALDGTLLFGSVTVAPGAIFRARGVVGGSVNVAGSLFAFPAGVSLRTSRRRGPSAMSG